jgi:hypothetical protein
MNVLVPKAQSTDVVAVTYGHRTETDTIAATAEGSYGGRSCRPGFGEARLREAGSLCQIQGYALAH